MLSMAIYASGCTKLRLAHGNPIPFSPRDVPQLSRHTLKEISAWERDDSYKGITTTIMLIKSV